MTVRISQPKNLQHGKIFAHLAFGGGHIKSRKDLRLNKNFHINQCARCGGRDFCDLHLNQKSRPEKDVVSVPDRVEVWVDSLKGINPYAASGKVSLTSSRIQPSTTKLRMAPATAVRFASVAHDFFQSST